MSILVTSHSRSGLCNRLYSISLLLKYYYINNKKIDLTFYWYNQCKDKFPTDFVSFYDVFKTENFFNIMSSDIKYQKTNEDILLTNDFDMLSNKKYIIDERVAQKNLIPLINETKYKNKSILFFNKNLLMTDKTQKYYNILMHKYLYIFETKRIVFLRCNYDMIDSFNKLYELNKNKITNKNDLFYIYDSTDEFTYKNIIQRIPNLNSDNSFNMFSFTTDKKERFFYMVALLFLATKAKYEIININHKSSYGKVLILNSKKEGI